MKKTLSLFIFILMWTGFSHTLLAQTTSCLDLGTNTDPNNPYDPRTGPVDANGTVIFLNNNKFDWRAQSYNWWKWDVNTQSWLATPVASPYVTLNNPNLVGYISVSNPDNKPEDGWELITYHFGKLYNGTFQAEDHPRFILYNRYTGILRVFFYYNMLVANQDYQTARIRLSFKTNDSWTKQSAILAYTERAVMPVDAFLTKLGFSGINEINIQSGQWVVADFPMAYDPCTCMHEYDFLNVTLELILNSTVSISGRIVTTDNLVVQNKAQSGSFPSDYKGALNSKRTPILQGAIEVITQGQKTFKTMEKFRKDLEKVLMTEKSSKSKDKKTEDVDQNFNLFIEAVPYLESAKGLIEFFTGGGKTSNAGIAAPMSFEADVNLSGTIETTVNATHHFFTVPGSIVPAVVQFNDRPMYNEVLGVFNLLETPELEFTDYLWDNYAGTCNSVTEPAAVRHFKVVSPIKYAVNPAAHLEIEKFDATFTINYGQELFDNARPKGDFFETPPFTAVVRTNTPQILFNTAPQFINPVPPFSFSYRIFPRPFEEIGPNYTGLTYEERLNRIGMGIETWNSNFPNSGKVVLNTSWLPVGAIQDQSFMIYRDGNYFGQSGCYDDNADRFPDPEILFKVHIVFKRTDHPNAQKVTFIASYRVKFTPNPLMLTNPGAFKFFPEIGVPCPGNPNLICSSAPNPGPVFFSSTNNLPPMGVEYLNTYRIPVDLELSNINAGPGDVRAIRSIHVGNNVTIASGTTLKASEEITFDPTNSIDPTVITQLEYPTANANLNPEQMKTTDFTDICNNLAKYNPIVPEGETAPPMPDRKSKANVLTNDFAIYPNPANLQAKIVYSIPQDANAKLLVIDAMGKEVITLTNSFHVQGQYIQSLDASQLPPGIYFCRLERNGEVSIKKFTIIK